MSKKKNSPPPSKREQRLFDNLLKTTHEFIKGRQYAPQTKKSLLERLNIHPDHLEIFESVLHSLKTTGKISFIGGKYHRAQSAEEYTLARGESVVRGSISVHPRGFGFVNQPSPKEDIFIPKPQINGAIDGDVVDVVTDLTTHSARGPEGKVVAVIERGRSQLAGTVIECHEKKALVYSSLLGELHPITCHLRPKEKVSVGDRVILDVASWGQKR
jgi:ribonuclease R